MDKSLNIHLDATFNGTNTSGVILADNQGHCIGKRGIVNEKLAGQIASFHNDSLSLWDQAKPIIVIEMESLKDKNNKKKVIVTSMTSKLCTAVIKDE